MKSLWLLDIQFFKSGSLHVGSSIRLIVFFIKKRISYFPAGTVDAKLPF